MKNGRFQVGIIGTGSIAKAHQQNYRLIEDLDIAALCDIVPGKAEAFAEKYEIDSARCYTDYKEMIEKEELDAVSVCTYNTAHAECTVYALDHGLHVLCEKPMSVTVDEAVEMMRAEKRSGKVLDIGFQPRYAPMTLKLRELVQSGELGEVYYAQTGGGRRRFIPGSTFIEKRTAGIGALADIGCYSIDLVLFALGYPKPVTVSAYKSDFFGKSKKYNGEDAGRFDVDDFAAAFIRFENGFVLDFRIAWAMHCDTPGDTIILGKEGGVRVPSTDCWNAGPGGELTYYHDVDGERVDTVIPYIEMPPNHYLFREKMRTFVEAAKAGLPSPIPTSEILINQVILDGIVRSAELGREVEVTVPEV